jgi:CRISPR system Cascade subunit CasD
MDIAMRRDYLVFRLYGPMCSWGDIAVGEVRPSTVHPSKSAILGLIAAAMGIKRPDTVSGEQERATLEEAHHALAQGYGFAVRVDAPGKPLVDYHTAQVPSSGIGRNRRQFATRRDELLAVPRADLNTILSRRDYRVDALYTVALWAWPGAPYTLAEIATRLHEPVFALYLGRKSCPLGLPLTAQVVMADNIVEAMAHAALPLPDDFGRRLVPPNMVPALYWDADGESGLPVEHAFTRRDAVHSRRRWQFQSRSEHHAALPGQEATDG